MRTVELPQTLDTQVPHYESSRWRDWCVLRNHCLVDGRYPSNIAIYGTSDEAVLRMFATAHISDDATITLPSGRVLTGAELRDEQAAAGLRHGGGAE